jgi:hypothetical protein
MPELAADGPIPELSPEAAAKPYAELPPTLGEYAGKVVGESMEMLSGAFRRAVYDESNWGKLGRAVMAAGAADSGANAEDFGLTPDLAAVPTPHLTKQQAADRHPEVAAAAPDLFADNMPEGVVDALADSKRHEIEREATFQRFEQAHSWPVNFAARTALTMLDPVNTAALFIPGVGEEAVLARLGSGVVARTAARGVAGATAGAAGMVPGVALRLGLSEADGGDYGLRQAFSDLASGAVLGALIHAGIGGVREAGLLKPDALMAHTAPILNADAATHRDATSAAVAQMLDGREVDVAPIFASARSLVEGLRSLTPFTLPTLDEQAIRLTSEEAALRERGAKIDRMLGHEPAAPPAPGFVRFYHGGEEPTSGGPRWLTPSEEYARRFRAPEGTENTVHYVDIPEGEFKTRAEVAHGFDEINNYYRAFEAPEDIAEGLKPLGLPAGSQAAAETLARLEEIDRQLAAATTATERKTLSNRRDELLADTTPEALRAAAAPLEQRRALAAEQASIADRLSEIDKTRAELKTIPQASFGQRSVVPYSLSSLAEQQRDLHQAGFIPSMPASELAVATEDLYGTGPKPEASTPVAARAPSEAGSTEEATALDRQLAEAEQAASRFTLSPEDHAEITAARAGTVQAGLLEQAYAMAADCLRIF